MASRPYFGAIFDPFWPFGCGATAPSGPGPPKVGVKLGGEPKLVGPEDPSAAIAVVLRGIARLRGKGAHF